MRPLFGIELILRRVSRLAAAILERRGSVPLPHRRPCGLRHDRSELAHEPRIATGLREAPERGEELWVENDYPDDPRQGLDRPYGCKAGQKSNFRALRDPAGRQGVGAAERDD